MRLLPRLLKTMSMPCARTLATDAITWLRMRGVQAPGTPAAAVARAVPDAATGGEDESESGGEDAFDRLLAGKARSVTCLGGFRACDLPLSSAAHFALLPGSFNPLHDGHVGLANAVQNRLRSHAEAQARVQSPPADVGGAGDAATGAEAAVLDSASAPATKPGTASDARLPLVMFELSAFNADKPPIDRAVIEARVAQFAQRGWGVVVTNAPLFANKARLFPGCHFVLGADTVVRLLMPRYYEQPGDTDGGSAAMEAALRGMADTGCKILVAGRLEQVKGQGSAVGGAFLTLKDVDVPRSLAGMFEELPEAEFRVDVSSTELRKQPQ